MMNRARTDAEKSERRLQILAAALGLFEARNGELTAVEDVARRAGLAKGTVYLYFSSREEIFLALLEEHFHVWIDRFESALAGHPGDAGGCEADLPGLVEALCEVPFTTPALLRLASLSNALLERNIEAATAMRYKRGLTQRLDEVGAGLERVLGLSCGAGASLLLHSHALLVGLWQLSEPAPVIREVLTSEELALLLVDFQREARTALLALWRGTLPDLTPRSFPAAARPPAPAL